MNDMGIGKRATTQLWERYKFFVAGATCAGTINTKEDITYWRDKLFTQFITYLLPTCFIALLPGVFMALKNGYLFIAVSDVLVVISIAAISLSTKLSLVFRKAFMIIVLYLLSIMLLVNLSLLGPGIVYLLAISMLVTVIFPRYWGYATVAANFLVCIGCAFIISLKLFNSPLIKDYGLGVWIAVSSNLVFLSLVMVMLVSAAIGGLEKTIIKELLSKNGLQKEIEKGVTANLSLSESESQYKSLFFKNPSPMWVLDKDSLQFLQVNEAAIRTYGYNNEEFLSMNIMDIKLGEDIGTLHKDMQENQRLGIPLNIVTQHRRKNQQQFYAEVIFNSISFEGREAILTISQDITEQVNYIKAIETQNEKFQEIAWIQSHEMRGPLATILGLIHLFNDKQIDVSAEEIIQGILCSSEKLDDVIKEIVDKSSGVDTHITSSNYTNR